ncbi:choline kinase family protein [Haploplasma modicum]|uniref:choline kinase family protein n=1 Tax=Haploplasma modicum TaxID=2150 RepID=UPI00214CF949|nr:choline kinase family protein [Haploplasma modicum]MCR1809007.1 choline kinase family protein [Haploplasma modicum]
MVDEIINEIKHIMNVEEIKNLTRFSEGMSNYTYYFESDNIKYVFRKIGLEADKYVDYYNELNSIIAASDNNLTSELVYFDPKTGTKIQKYIEGNTIDFKNFSLFKNKLIDSLKKLHKIKNPSVKDYDLINRLNKYESYNKDNIIDEKYFAVKEYFINVYNNKYKNTEKVFCHNDLQNINVIDTDNKIYFIDFEYAGLNDIYYEFACFEENSTLVLEAYFDRKITKEEDNHIKLYKIYQSLQWYNVALYKESVGFSKLTNYNFLDLANYFISNAYKIYLEIREELI